MRIFTIRSIRTRIMLIVMPTVVLAMVAMSLLTYQNSKSLINQEIDSKMQYQLSATAASIETQLTAHLKIPETLARAVEAAGDHIEQEVLIDMIMRCLATNPDTFGVGVWYEPRQFKKYVEYFGPYAYRYNGQVQYTLDYSTKAYDYPNQNFYLIGKDTKKPVLWTNPYYDENSKSAVLTTTAPFYHYDRKFRGVVTANINLDNLQRMIATIKVGDKGRAFLVDRNGTYIADRDATKLLQMKAMNDPNASLAAAGRSMANHSDGFAVYDEGDGAGRMRLYYKEVSLTGWKLAMAIPESELYRPLNELLVKSAIAILATLLIVASVIYLFARYMKRQFNQVSALSSAMAQGDFTRSIEIRSQDEVGRMVADLNRMTRELGSVIVQMTLNADLVAGTSEQLTDSTEQTTRATAQIAESIQSVAAGSESQLMLMRDVNSKSLDMARGLEEMSLRIASVSEVSDKTLLMAKEGNDTIQTAVGQIQMMDVKTALAAQIVDSLTSRSHQIDATMHMISKISLQTKILALNAGITASQAGEQGKAFKVIAEEIRLLAEDTGGASQQIQNIIGEIQNEIQQAKAAMNYSQQAVSGGKIQMEKAGRFFEQIVAAVYEVSKETRGVAEFIESIDLYLTALVHAIDRITEISASYARQTGSVSASTEEQMASMESIYSGAVTLASVANEFRDTIRRFKV